MDEQPQLTVEEAEVVFVVLNEELGCLPALKRSFLEIATGPGLRSFQFDGWKLSRDGDTPKFLFRGLSMAVEEVDAPGMRQGDWQEQLLWANIFIENRLLELRQRPRPLRPEPRSRLSGLARQALGAT